MGATSRVRPYALLVLQAHPWLACVMLSLQIRVLYAVARLLCGTPYIFRWQVEPARLLCCT